MELTGKIIAVLPAKSGVSPKTGNSWMAQEYVIEVPGQYPKRCAFSVFGEDRIKLFNIQSGEDITIQFDIEAREFNGRWYNDVRVYNVLRAQNQEQATEVASQVANPFPIGEVSDGDGGDLPF